MVVGRGQAGASLDEAEIQRIVDEGVPAKLFDGKRVLVLTPDATRTFPLPLLSRVVGRAIGHRASRMDFMIALGSHTPMSDHAIDTLFGLGPGERERLFPGSQFLNHRWDLPGTLEKIGTIPAREVRDLTRGLMDESADVVINRAIREYDLLLILGPVFPHEVIGFSGGNKYLFPGISGGEFLSFFHWMGALITCPEIIGFKNTVVRATVDRAAAMVSVNRWCLAGVVGPNGRLAGLFAGASEEAWSRAADLSAQIHVVYKEQPFRTVLGLAPAMYDELWVAGKVMYKLEPVVAEGGTLIIHGPHVKEVSRTWGTHLLRTGYHVRDWFLAHPELCHDVPRAVLAHSTHVRGIGSMVGGVEKPRIQVVLATGIPEEVCRQIGLGYCDPGSIHPSEYADREDEGVLLVDHAGEVLHRLEQDRARMKS